MNTDWLTPSLIGAAVVAFGWLNLNLIGMRRDLLKVLQTLVRHETVLQQQGFFEPHGYKIRAKAGD